jgi:hypothetical protein
MPAGCGRRQGAFIDKYPHAGPCSEHIRKLIPAGLWRRFASAVRVFVLGYLRAAADEAGHDSASACSASTH